MANPLAGISGGVNAPGKKRGPQFPGGLDQHFATPSLAGVGGHVTAPGPRVNFNLGGVTGHTLAPAPTAPPLKGISGGNLGRISGGIGAAPNQKFITYRLPGGKIANPEQAERMLTAGLRKGATASPAAHSLGSKEIAKVQLRNLQVAGPSKNLLAAAGKGLEYAPKKLASEAVNIPAQVPVAIAKTGIASVNAIKGHPQELEHLGKEFVEQSAVAHLFKGEFSKAFAKAEEHPLMTGLEATGAGSVADRFAGAIKGTKAIDSTAVVSREPKPLPETAAPKGGAVQPLKPYDKGLVRRRNEEALEQRPMTEGKAGASLRRNFDSFEAEQLAATRAARDRLSKEHGKLFKKLGSSAEAVPHFASGLLADPAIRAVDGSPLYQQHLAEAITHYEKEPPNETIVGAHQRTAVLAQLRALQHENPDLTRAYAADKTIAAQARAKEPEMVQHHIVTPETVRIAKLIKPFQFHFRNEDPYVDPTSGQGESPFRLGGADGRIVPVSEVAQKLEAKGVHEDQLAFSSTRPFMTEAQALLSGRRLAGARTSSGHLTGYNYIRGHFDSSPEALTRQLQTTTKAINEARGQNEFNRRYPFKGKELAKIIRDRVGRAETGGQVITLKGYADQLAKSKDAYFKSLGEAKEAQQHLDSLGVHMEPVRVAHPYATAAFREGMAEKFADHADMQDRLEPLNAGDEPVRSRLAPDGVPAETAGPWALVHPSIASKIREYERNLGSAHILQMPSSAWRRLNVAFSVRHIMPGGVPQEMGIRMAANNVGAISGMRGTRLMNYLKEWAKDQPPEVKTQLQRLEAHTGGTIASFTAGQGKHIPLRQLADTRLEKPMRWWLKGETRKVAGAPLRGMRMLVKGTNKTTNAILSAERKIVEHPPQTAGIGRHAAEEFKRIHGKRMKALGAMDDLEKSFARGLLDPKTVDHAANVFTNYWGDWMNSSPKFRNAQAFIPFLRWFNNSLRFIYQVMPRDHPVQTSLLVAMEQATAEERKLEGQGYKPGTLGFPTLEKGQLPEYQQGSIEIKPGERLGAEYYTPSGAVSGGVEGALGSLVPYASSIYSTMKGVNPVTNHIIEEENPETGRKEPITDQSKLFWKGVLSGLESGVPPYRYVSQLKEKSAGHVFRPFRTERQHTLGGKAFEGILKQDRGSRGTQLPSAALPTTELPTTALPNATLP